MMDYTELIRSLRNCSNNRCAPCDCGWFNKYQVDESCKEIIMWKAAAAIEALQAEIKRLKEVIDELREAQTYIDHYGDKWLTSAKDVPTAAYEHGYADGRDEAEAQLPKRGEWKPFDLTYGRSIYSCSVCEQATEVPMCMEKPMYAYCPNCGAKMNDSNALNALDNAQDGPIITPCRGCSDYDGYGGCKSKGGCAMAKMEVQE